MQIELDGRRYEWIEDWATVADTESARENGRTHGIETTEDGRVVVFNQSDPAVLVFDADGDRLDSWGSRFGGAHGLSCVVEDGSEYLWLTDQDSAEVAKITLGGETVATLDPPDHPAYDDGSYVPTWVAVNEHRHGRNGDVWVADGYGENLVHRYRADGTYVESIDGREGEAGAFDCPHGIMFDTRGDAGDGEAELYIADRGNERIQVYGPDGEFRRAFGSDALTSPCAFDVHDGELIVPELYARTTIFDAEDELVGHLGENESVVEAEAWPNVPEGLIEPGRFNSPHDAAVDGAGNIYVVEWIVGGRITKLRRLD
jgi:DNA-binding beta-propeller fold protein YncE